MKKLPKIFFSNSLILFSLFALATFADASGPNCYDPRAAEIGTPDGEMNGFFVGANGCAYDPALVSSDEVPPVGQTSGYAGDPIFIVNGGNVTELGIEVRLEGLWLLKKRPVIGIYNAKMDVKNAVKKFIDPDNKVSATIRAEAFARVLDNRRFSLISLSQSGFLVGRGLRQFVKDIEETYPLQPLYRQELLKLVDVETSAGLGLYYPDGPNYVHYVNRRDIIPVKAGMLSSKAHPGRGAVIATFWYLNANCKFGMLPLEEYPGVDGDLSENVSPSFGEKVHSFCTYAATGYKFEELRKHAPLKGHKVVSIDLTP